MRTFMLCAALAALPGTGAAQATDAGYPARQIRLVVGYTPGGAADTIARIVGEGMARELGQPVVVDNKPGAGSTLASELIARAAPDGYTLGLASGTLYGVDQQLYKVKYTPADFTPITRLTVSPLILAVNRNLGAKSLAELAARAKASSAGLDYSSSGNGGSPHVAALMFQQAVGAPMTHVPYKGGAPALQAVAQGDVHFSFGTAASVLPLGKQGVVQMLGISSATRSAIAPELVPLAEQGLPGFEFTFWFGLFGPAKLPAPVADKLYAAALKVLNTPEVKARLLATGNEVAPSPSPAAFHQWATADGQRARDRVEQAKVKLD
ncbi:MAG: tripartite tricarboxylate transporter substrate binding protein [Burkholderiales bacterium]|nr:tripartite tricarboxylate transporter substrate binding protein [Burkholderiales bacterium]